MAQPRCLVDGVAAFRQARDSGFRFEAVRIDATRCEITESTIVVAAPLQRDAYCAFLVLGGRGLASPWKIQSFVTSISDGTRLDLVRVQKGWVFKIQAAKAQTSRVSIHGIRLVGGDCTDATDAFQ
jgi:hypothetical protein